MTIYTDPRLTALGIVHGMTSRTLGDMRTAEPVAALWNTLQLPAERILRFKQIHSTRILSATHPSLAKQIQSGPLQTADGWILGAAGWGAAIITADCVPLFVWDAKARLIGLSHCGWRGVAAQLPAQTAQALYQAGAQGPLYAWVGPHIQSCCFEVQTDVAQQFPQATSQKKGRLWVDLNQAIRTQLTQAGLALDNIVFSSHCTCCETDHFFSYRRDHTRQAMLSFVYIPPSSCIED